MMTGIAVPMNKTVVERKQPLRTSLPMAALLLGTTVLAGLPQTAMAQAAPASDPGEDDDLPF